MKKYQPFIEGRRALYVDCTRTHRRKAPSIWRIATFARDDETGEWIDETPITHRSDGRTWACSKCHLNLTLADPAPLFDALDLIIEHQNRVSLHSLIRVVHEIQRRSKVA